MMNSARFGGPFLAVPLPIRFPTAVLGSCPSTKRLIFLASRGPYPLLAHQRVRFPSGSGRARSGRRKLVFGTLAGLTAAASESGRSNAAAEGGLRLSDKTREVLAPRQGSNLQPSGSKPDALSG